MIAQCSHAVSWFHLSISLPLPTVISIISVFLFHFFCVHFEKLSVKIVNSAAFDLGTKDIM